MPAAVKVCANVAPAFSEPLSKDALSAVTVCFEPSSLVHVTVPPTAIVADAGAKRAPARWIEAVAGAVGAGGAPGVVAGGAVTGVASLVTMIVPWYAATWSLRWST